MAPEPKPDIETCVVENNSAPPTELHLAKTNMETLGLPLETLAAVPMLIPFLNNATAFIADLLAFQNPTLLVAPKLSALALLIEVLFVKAIRLSPAAE